MKPLFNSFLVFIKQILRDSMLYMVLAAPILAGSAFKFGIPVAESALCNYFNQNSILSGYYLLFDLFLAVMTPYIICFVSSMVILSEHDDNMSSYMAVTPVGKRGYIISRLIFPAIISIILSMIVMRLFSLTNWSISNLLIVSFLSSLFSIALALLIVAFSHNRIEGMALAKLSGVFLLGLPVPFFLFSNIQYLFSLTPSFWIAKIFVKKSYPINTLLAVLTSCFWIWILYGRFAKKLY